MAAAVTVMKAGGISNPAGRNRPYSSRPTQMAPDIDEIIRFTRSLEMTSESTERLYRFLLGVFEMERPQAQPPTWPGKLISVDGHSGSGKDTQIELLERRLGNRVGRNVASVILKRCDPFRAVAKALWASAEDGDSSFLLLSAGRKYVTEAVVLPLLRDPECVVLQNRSFLSHVAYHSGKHRADELLAVCESDPRPDLSLVLTCDPSVAWARIQRRASQTHRKIHLNETPAFIDRTRENFQALAAADDSLVLIDTSASVSSVAEQIGQRVDRCLGNA